MALAPWVITNECHAIEQAHKQAVEHRMAITVIRYFVAGRAQYDLTTYSDTHRAIYTALPPFFKGNPRYQTAKEEQS